MPLKCVAWFAEESALCTNLNSLCALSRWLGMIKVTDEPANSEQNYHTFLTLDDTKMVREVRIFTAVHSLSGLGAGDWPRD